MRRKSHLEKEYLHLAKSYRERAKYSVEKAGEYAGTDPDNEGVCLDNAKKYHLNALKCARRADEVRKEGERHVATNDPV